MLDLSNISLGLSLLPLLLLATGVDAAMPDPASDPDRVALSDLRPRIADADGDIGKPYSAGCHVAVEITTPTQCRFGDRDGPLVLVVLGDSAVAQWWGAI